MGSDVKALIERLRRLSRDINNGVAEPHFDAEAPELAAEALEKAEAVIGPFAGYHRPGDNDDHHLVARLPFRHLRAAADWKRQYGRDQDNG